MSELIQKTLEFSECNGVKDSYSKSVNMKRGSKILLDTDVILENANTGRTIFRGSNKLLLHGSRNFLMKMFNVDSSLNLKNLNTILGVNTVEDAKNFLGPRQDDCISMFAVGTGGASDTFGTIYEVKYNEMDVKGIVPFRYTQNPLSMEDKEKYFLKKQDTTYMAYYLKKFETQPILKSLFTDGSEIPVNVDDQQRDDINTFIELKLKINSSDCRDWFAVKGGGVEKAKINTLSLISGYPFVDAKGNLDYKLCKVNTKINFINEALSNEKEINIIYRIYI